MRVELEVALVSALREWVAAATSVRQSYERLTEAEMSLIQVARVVIAHAHDAAVAAGGDLSMGSGDDPTVVTMPVVDAPGVGECDAAQIVLEEMLRQRGGGAL